MKIDDTAVMKQSIVNAFHAFKYNKPLLDKLIDGEYFCAAVTTDESKELHYMIDFTRKATYKTKEFMYLIQEIYNSFFMYGKYSKEC